MFNELLGTLELWVENFAKVFFFFFFLEAEGELSLGIFGAQKYPHAWDCSTLSFLTSGLSRIQL